MTLGRTLAPARKERMMEAKPMWQTVKEIEERMATFDKEHIVSSVFSAIAREYNMALGLWSVKDVANRIYEKTNWGYEREDEIYAIANPIWDDIAGYMSSNMNNGEMLDKVNINDRIADALEEEGMNV
jgi:hypothetical protein